MGHVCAWCRDEISASDGGHSRPLDAVSHGICRPCLDARIAALPPIRTRARDLDQGRAARPSVRGLERAPFALV
jgi:hypothetical protein